ncbi:MAG: thioredoxin [Chloroflexia bacterium]|nr:thioredoxin [Chloroflexia bacterium]
MSNQNNILHVGDQDFEEIILQAELPAMVDFWAPWCGPCLMVAPTIEALAQEYNGRLVVAKLNTDEHQQWARHLGIRGIPTIIFFQNGQEVDRVVGALPKDALKQKLEMALGLE